MDEQKIDNDGPVPIEFLFSGSDVGGKRVVVPEVSAPPDFWSSSWDAYLRGLHQSGELRKLSQVVASQGLLWDKLFPTGEVATGEVTYVRSPITPKAYTFSFGHSGEHTFTDHRPTDQRHGVEPTIINPETGEPSYPFSLFLRPIPDAPPGVPWIRLDKTFPIMEFVPDTDPLAHLNLVAGDEIGTDWGGEAGRICEYTVRSDRPPRISLERRRITLPNRNDIDFGSAFLQQQDGGVWEISIGKAPQMFVEVDTFYVGGRREHYSINSGVVRKETGSDLTVWGYGFYPNTGKWVDYHFTLPSTAFDIARKLAFRDYRKLLPEVDITIPVS